MGKKQVAVSLRKPPPADPDAFVSGGAPPVIHAPPPPPVRGVEGANVTTRVGERREVTVYLPQDLARALSVRCVELDRDVSNIVAEAVEKALSAEEPVRVAVPEDRWSRAKALIEEVRLRFGLRWSLA